MNIKKIISKVKKHGFSKYNSGITLIELMVVLAIFAIIMSISLYDYGSFRSQVSLQNLADDIGLSARRAQSYSIGVHNSLNSFANGFGIHFATQGSRFPLGGSNKAFVIFSDLSNGNTPPDKVYQYGEGDTSQCGASSLQVGQECLDFLNITTNDEVSSLCPNSVKTNCIKGYADIVFQRPNPDAHICVFDIKAGAYVSNLTSGTGPIDTGGGSCIDKCVAGGTDKETCAKNCANTDVAPPADAGTGGDINPVDTPGLACYNECVANGGATDECSKSCGYTPPVDGGGGGTTTDSCPALTSVDVIVKNITSGETKTVTITNIGQISVN